MWRVDNGNTFSAQNTRCKSKVILTLPRLNESTTETHDRKCTALHNHPCYKEDDANNLSASPTTGEQLLSRLNWSGSARQLLEGH